MILHLSLSCLPPVSQYALDALPACFCICLPLVSACLFLPLASQLSPTALWMLCPHDFWVVSHLPRALARACRPLVSQLSPTAVRMISGLSRTRPSCLPLNSGFSARTCLHLLSPNSPWMMWVLRSAWFHTCLPLVSYYTAWLSPLVPTSLPLVSQYMLDALSALVRMISRLSPTSRPVVSHYILDSLRARFQASLQPVSTCLPLASQYTLDALSALARMISNLFPTYLPLHCILCPHDLRRLPVHTVDDLKNLVCMILHLSPSCLSLHFGWSACMISRLVTHWLPLVSHLYPMPVFPVVSHESLDSLPVWFQACLPLVSTCLPALWMLWVLWSAWGRTSLPLVSHYTLDFLTGWRDDFSSDCFSSRDFALVSHLSPSCTCLSLVSYCTLDSLSAWFHMSLPLVSTCLHY